MADKVLLLCSGVALGVYIPAIKLNYQFQERQIDSEVVVLENYMIEEKRNKINENKKQFHDNFKFALKGQQLALATDIRHSLDRELLQDLFETWHREGRSSFLIFSGYWLPILEMYKETYGLSCIGIDILHIDSDYSPSFKNYLDLCGQHRNIWLFHHDTGRLVNQIVVTDEKPVPFSLRNNRFVIHGGGWGMGTYQSKVPELRTRGILLDIVVYYREEAQFGHDGERFFMADPEWLPWVRNERGQHTFPPFAEIVPDAAAQFRHVPEHHLFFEITRQAKGIISKPGGSTLVDSLASATPIIFLEPFGEHEQKNADLWIWLGFGITYDAWRQSGFSSEILEGLHTNLKAKRTTINDLGRNYHAAENRS